ncbi:C-type lectin domain family 2 member B-like [Tiliqua scincoides]|uniref:C-type lectin domain family 2 member B-like n=1 Tax=Tiliqua scincoides TaxID=71010 RepID=UPI0034634DA1
MASEEVALRERRSLVEPGGASHQRNREAICKIQEVLSNERVVKFIALLYRVISLFLLFAIATVVVLAGNQIEQLARAMVSPAHCGPPCPRHWIDYEGKCYFFSREKRNWTSSQNFCSSFNASLARIEIGEKDFVMRLKCKDISWIGLWRNSDNSWLWSDGEMSILEVIGEGGDCAYLDNEGKAISSGCHTKLPWICSKPAAYTTPNTV